MKNGILKLAHATLANRRSLRVNPKGISFVNSAACHQLLILKNENFSYVFEAESLRHKNNSETSGPLSPPRMIHRQTLKTVEPVMHRLAVIGYFLGF
jgi:hypothetical protein